MNLICLAPKNITKSSWGDRPFIQLAHTGVRNEAQAYATTAGAFHCELRHALIMLARLTDRPTLDEVVLLGSGEHGSGVSERG